MPPGRVSASDLMMQWLCSEWLARLWRGSCSRTSANGTLPTAASNVPAGYGVAAKDSVRIVASGYSAVAIAAVVGSSSTPTMSADAGAMPMKVPAPAPGSSTRPPSKPSSPSAVQIALT